EGDQNAIHAADLWRRSKRCDRGQGHGRADFTCLCCLYGGDAEGARHGRRRAPAPDLVGDHRADPRWQTPGARRPLRRDQGAAWRLLHRRRARSGRRNLLGDALSRRQSRRCRSAADLDRVRSIAMPGESDQQARETAEAVARRSYGKLVAFLAGRTRDVPAAEDALSDAFAAALVDWPERGIPTSPEAWLMTVARRKLIDAVRRRRSGEGAADHLRLVAEELEAVVASKPQIPDERLSLMFACPHPAIERGIRAPLMLQTILGFDAATIASAFLVSPATMGQRLTRAKNKIRQAGIPFRVPERTDLRERLDSVLEAIYAAFAEGWSDPAGTEIRRRNLAEEAIWLGRLVVALLPDEAEALGLLALMLHAEARRGARRDARGDYVPLAAQDPAAW